MILTRRKHNFILACIFAFAIVMILPGRVEASTMLLGDDDKDLPAGETSKKKKSYTLRSNKDAWWKIALRNNWSITASGGFASYFGDVSIYDFDAINKVKLESRFSNGISLNNKFLPWLGVQARIVNANFKAEKPGINRRLEGKTFMYALNLTFDIVALLSYPNPVPEYVDIYVYGIIGLGNSIISSKLYNLESDDLIYMSNDKIKESTFVFGLGLNKTLYGNFDVTFESFWNKIGTDELDRRVGYKENDYYLYTAFGLKYNINPLKKNKKRRATYDAPSRR